MKKQIRIGAIAVAVGTAIGTALFFSSRPPALAETGAIVAPDTTPHPVPSTNSPSTTGSFGWPIDDAEGRVTKKTFGLKIEPGHSPVPNDRFAGYHVGVDFETTEAEADIDVPIYAICDGEVLFKEFAGGYGGIAVQECLLDGEPVSALYGHLNLSRIEVSAGDMLVRGDRIGVLGKGYSPETDGVRKHLHLSVHPGTNVDIRGYVKTLVETTKWLDPVRYMSATTPR